MYPSSLLLLLTLPFLAFAQSSSTTTANSASNSASANSASTNSSSTSGGGSSSTAFTTITSTSLSTFVAIVTSGGSRVESTIVSTSVFATVQPVSTGNSSSNSNSSASSSSTTTTAQNLPTAPTDVNGGGQGGAPSPGAKTGNGALGPDDNYIAAAAGLATKALLASAVACIVGGALVL